MAALTTLCSYGQKVKDKNVPLLAKTTFTHQFAQAKNVKWENENENTFEASFVMGETEYSTLIDDSGKWIETEIEISRNGSPEEVLESIRKELEKGELTYEGQFSENGTIIKKETAESNERG